MVLFRPELIEKNLAGLKWETRRVWTDPKVKVGGVYGIHRKFMEPKKEAPAWMLVTAMRKERVDAIRDEGAVAEGYANRKEFLEAWTRNFDRPDLSQEVYVVTYIVVPVGFTFTRGETSLPCANCAGMVTLHAKHDFWTHTAMKGTEECHVAFPRRMLVGGGTK